MTWDAFLKVCENIYHLKMNNVISNVCAHIFVCVSVPSVIHAFLVLVKGPRSAYSLLNSVVNDIINKQLRAWVCLRLPGRGLSCPCTVVHCSQRRWLRIPPLLCWWLCDLERACHCSAWHWPGWRVQGDLSSSRASHDVDFLCSGGYSTANTCFPLSAVLNRSLDGFL